MEQVELAGWRNGLLTQLLLIVPNEGEWDEAWSKVETKLEENRSNASWQGAQLTLDLASRSLNHEQLEWVVARLKSTYGLLPVAVVATDNTTREAAKSLILSSYMMLPGNSKDPAVVVNKNNALYISHTVRSGQKIVHDGNVVIGGSVNAGAEVVADGDIIVAGTLRGIAHAGSSGDEKARIFAGDMRPQQLRIAEQIARAPEEKGKSSDTRQPEVAFIENGAIQVDAV